MISWNYVHSRAPFFSSYIKPTININKNGIIGMRAEYRRALRIIAQGNRNAISRSNMINRIEIR